jgi:galactokinase
MTLGSSEGEAIVGDVLRARVLGEFEHRLGGVPAVCARAPGRVNLIGDHTDYNEGFVLPMAIDREVWIAARIRTDRSVVVHSLDFAEDASFVIGDDRHRGGWIEYLHGVAWALEQQGLHPLAWEGIVAGNVPVGAGLSSSAALEVAVARTFAAVSGIPWDARTMALIAQRAENEWVGVNCGIMDQLISAAGRAGHALLIDCRSLDTRVVALPDDVAVVVLDTATRRGLVESAYNERRAQCEQAARSFGVRALRDVDLASFESRQAQLDPITRRRARHVVTENARTIEAALLLERGNSAAVGGLMNESHASLRDDFAVSRSELDTMVELAQRDSACFGARMTGAGFGGCAVALVERNAADAFARNVASQYAETAGLQPKVYVCAAAEGASIEPLA